MFQICAGEIFASITIFYLPVFELVAGFDFASYPGDRLKSVNPAAGAMVLLSQISHADAAVHAARSD